MGLYAMGASSPLCAPMTAALLTTLLVSSAEFLGACGHWGGHINGVLGDCQELALPFIALLHKPQYQLLKLQQLYLERKRSA